MKNEKKTLSYVQFKNKTQSNKITHGAAAADDDDDEDEEQQQQEKMLMSLLGSLGLMLEQLQSLTGG